MDTAFLQTRRESLVTLHQETQRIASQAIAQLQRVEGALALCDELIAASSAEETPPADSPADPTPPCSD